MTDGKSSEVLAELLFGRNGDEYVYAVLDGASMPDLLDQLVGFNPSHRCLYRGELEPDIAEVAPYLVLLEPEHDFTEWLLSEGWGKHWGIFALASEDLDVVRRHFRRFLMVRDPEHEPLYFRYYDPRVLRVFLPTCNEAELAEMFGPLSCYFAEGELPSTCLQFEFRNGELSVQTHEMPLPHGADATSGQE